MKKNKSTLLPRTVLISFNFGKTNLKWICLLAISLLLTQLSFAQSSNIQFSLHKNSCNSNYFIDTDIKNPKLIVNNISNLDKDVYHLFTHGRSGELYVNGKWLNKQQIVSFIKNLKLSATSLNIYGCEFAKGEKGKQAVFYLEEALNVKVNASTNITGKDGDWILEVGQKNSNHFSAYQYNLQFCPNEDGTASNPFKDLGKARNISTAGVYYFDINGTTFSTYVDADGYIQAAIDFGNGNGNLPQGTSLTNTTRGILSPAVLATLTDANEIRLSHSGGALDATSSASVLLNKLFSNTTLHTGINDNADNSSWTGTGAIVLTGTGSDGTSTAGSQLQENIFHPRGDRSGFHWIPSIGSQLITVNSGEIPDSESLHLWVRANATIDSDCDGVNDSSDLDDDNDGVLDAIESPFTCPQFGSNALFPNYDYSNGVVSNGGSVMTFTGVMSNNGTPVDMVITATSGSFSFSPNGNADCAGDNGFAINGAANGETVLFEFVESGTTTPVEVNYGAYMDDFDLSEAIEISTDGLLAFGENPNNSTTTNGNASTYTFTSGNTNATDDDFVFYYQNISDFTLIFRSAGSGSRNYCFGSGASNPPSAFDCTVLLVPFIDTDSDSIPNHLDLDSDGDGCPDAVEAGISLDDLESGTVVNGDGANNTSTVTANAIASGDYGANGLANSLENDDSQTAMTNYTSTYRDYALNLGIDYCQDADNDSIPDALDLDDDNDGILDVDEGLSSIPLDELDGIRDAQNTSLNFSADVSCPVNTQSINLTTVSFDFGWNNGANASPNINTGDPVTSNTRSMLTLSENGIVYLTIETPNDGDSNTDNATEFGGDAIIRVFNGATFTNSNASAQGESFIDHSLYNNWVYSTIKVTLPITVVGSIDFEADLRSDDFSIINAEAESACAVDTDGDGIPNYQDLDSDGDNCPDAVEAGIATSNLESGTVVNGDGTNNTSTVTDNAIASGIYGNNGLANSLETNDSQTATTNYTSTYTDYALNRGIDYCQDTDNDGVPDISDIDDDNDGILDAVESPECFYTKEEAALITTVTSDVPARTASETIDNIIDGNINSIASFTDNAASVGDAFFTVTPTAPLAIDALEYFSRNWPLTSGSSRFKLQGFDGVNWVDLSPDLPSQNPGNIHLIPNTLQPNQVYSMYQIILSAGNNDLGGIREVKLIPSDSYQASLNPKASCTNDLDNDGVYNHLDLDSDDDDCPDALEAGITETLQDGDVVNGDGTTNTTTSTANAILDPNGADVNNDGLNDSVDANQDHLPDYASTYEYYAIDTTRNFCIDLDGDGVPDLTDIDDDNDGILDAVESPKCFYNIDEAAIITEVTTDIALTSGNPIEATIDGMSNTSAFYVDGSGNVGDAFFTVTPTVPIAIDTLKYNPASRTLTRTTSRSKLQGFNGHTWVDLSPDLEDGSASTLQKIPNTLQPGVVFSRYQLVISVGTNYSGGVAEIELVPSDNYRNSLHPKPSCTDDFDNDGIYNHQDLDSDRDGCPDTTESSIFPSNNNDLQDALVTNGNGTDASANQESNQVNAQLNPEGDDINNDGLNDSVDTNQDGVPDNQSTYLIYALDGFQGLCVDTDEDGVPDVIDIDDDNDGILDTDEGFNCIDFDLGADGTFESLSGVALDGGTGQNQFNSNVTDGGWRNASNTADTWQAMVNTLGESSNNGLYVGLADGMSASPQGGIFAAALKGESFETTVNNLMVGVTYRLSFYQANAGNEGFTEVGSESRWSVTFGGDGQFSDFIAYRGEENQIWQKQVLFFTATATSQVLNFAATDASSTPNTTYMAVDGIQLDYATEDNCALDTDNDGVPDYLDLDSDRDGCPDAKEAGVPGTLENGDVENGDGTSNTTVNTENAISAGPYGNNGLANSLENGDDTSEATTSYTSTYTAMALNTMENSCSSLEDDFGITNQNMPVTLDILDNDDDIISDNQMTVTTQPSNGSVTIDDNGTPNDMTDDTMIYTPNSGFTGEDSFDYEVCDTGSSANCQTARVTVRVLPDYDGDSITDADDLDDDNDGILDVDENCVATSPAIHDGTISFNSDQSTSGTTVTVSTQQTNANVSIIGNYNPPRSFVINGQQRVEYTSSVQINPDATSNETIITYTFSNPILASEVGIMIEDIDRGTPTGMISVSGGTATTDDFSIESILRNGESSESPEINYTTTTGGIDFPSAPSSTNRFTSIIRGQGSNTLSELQLTISDLGNSGASGDNVRIYLVPLVDCDNDLDNDGISNSLDLDTDGDGCPDAIEGAGSYVFLDLETNTNIAGGPTNVQQNLGTSSNNDGTPNVEGTSTTDSETQAIGESQNNANKSACSIDLSLTKKVNTAIVKLGGTITYTLQVSNKSMTNATGVAVNNILPAGVSFVSASSTNYNTGTNVWNVGAVQANGTATLQVTARVNSAGTIVSKSEILQTNETDQDSTPNNSN